MASLLPVGERVGQLSRVEDTLSLRQVLWKSFKESRADVLRQCDLDHPRMFWYGNRKVRQAWFPGGFLAWARGDEFSQTTNAELFGNQAGISFACEWVFQLAHQRGLMARQSSKSLVGYLRDDGTVVLEKEFWIFDKPFHDCFAVAASTHVGAVHTRTTLRIVDIRRW